MNSLFSYICVAVFSLSNILFGVTYPNQISSGYLASARANVPIYERFTQISGSWNVPTLSPTQTASTCLVGITLNTRHHYTFNNIRVLSRIYTTHRWDPLTGTQENLAFIATNTSGSEFIPNFPVSNNDIIHGEIEHLHHKNFQFTVTNRTKNITVTFKRKEQSMQDLPTDALWGVSSNLYETIMRPLPLANFGTITFDHCFVTADGKHGSISSAQHSRLDLTTFINSGRVNRAVASELESHGEKFHVTWEHE